MKDTLEILKGIISDPLPYVSGGFIFGLSETQWDLLFKILLASPTILWTWYKVYNEMKKYKEKKQSDSTDL